MKYSNAFRGILGVSFISIKNTYNIIAELYKNGKEKYWETL
jgi:hypothetical protein